MPSYLEPRRLTPATDAYDQEQAAMSTVNQQAAGQDVIAQEQKSADAFQRQLRDQEQIARTAQRQQETDQRKQASADKELLGRQKKAGIKTQIDAAGRGQMVAHPDGAPVYEHGFQGDPEAGPDGQHVVKYRTPRGQVIPVPTNAIRSTQDEAGAPQYEFDVPKEDGTKETIKQPVGSKPLFAIDPKTGMRFTGAADPETGSVGKTPIGYDPVARSKAVLEQKKLEFAQQTDERKFKADEINLAQNVKETNLAPLKTQLTQAQAEAKKLAKDKIQYRNDPEKGLVKVADFGSGPQDVPVSTTDPSAISQAQAWLDKKAATDKALEDIKASHDPLAAEVLIMQQQRDQLALEHLKAGHETQVQLKRMEEAHKAGIPVYQPDWQKKLDERRTDPRVTDIYTQAALDESGSNVLADDARRVSLPETSKLLTRALTTAVNAPQGMTPYSMGTNLENPQGFKPDLTRTDRLQRPETTLANQLSEHLTADNKAPNGADVKAIAAQSLGITDPDKWQVAPVEGPRASLGYHSLVHEGEQVGEIDTQQHRLILNQPDTAGLDKQQQRLINTSGNTGMPVYYASATPPLPRPAVRDMLQQGFEVKQSTTDPQEAEANLAAAKLAPSDIRQKVLDGQLSVQDGRLLNETFHGVRDIYASKAGIADAFTKFIASPVRSALFKNGDDTVKAEQVNDFFNGMAARSSLNIIQPSRSEFAKQRAEFLATIDKRSGAGKAVDAVTGFPKQIIAPLAGMIVEAAAVPLWYGPRKLLGYKDVEADLIWNGSRDLGQRLANTANPVHRMFGQGEMKSLLQDLRTSADKFQSVDDIPDELNQKIRDATYDGYFRFTDQNAKDVNTSRDTFDIKKDPALRSMFDRYLQTADGSTFDGMLQMLSMTGNDRATQQQTMKYLERPQVATADNVMERAKLLNLSLDPARAGQVLTIGKQLNTVKDEKQYKNLITQAGKAMGIEKPADIQLALSHLTREETDAPDSWRSLFRSGTVANVGEFATEAISDIATGALTASIIGAPAGVALKGAQAGARQGLKQLFKAPVTALRQQVSKVIGGSLDSLAEKSVRFANGRTALARGRAGIATKAGELADKYKRLGIVEPTFGSPLTTIQKGRNAAVGMAKAAAASAVPESIEEGTMAVLDAAPTPENLVNSMITGALGGTVLVPMFAGATALNRAWTSGKRTQDIASYKSGIVDKFNQRMEGQSGFTPMTVDDFDTMQGIQDNPMHQTALREHAAALGELDAAAQDHAQNVMEMQDAAAGNAVPEVPDSPRLLTAQANAEATAANLEGAASMAFSATDELRALPADQRALYTGIAKAVSGAEDYTQEEAKALIGLGGQSAVAFQQAQALPADVAGPRQVKTLPGSPTVQQTGTGHYRLPPGVRIQVPPQAIEALKQRAPSLTGLISGQTQAIAPPSATGQPTGQNVPQQNGAEQPAPSPAPYSGVTPALETRLKQHGVTVSYTPEEQAEVNQKWGASSPFNTPPTFIDGGKGTAKALPKGAVMDDTPIAENEVLSAVQNAVAFEVRKRNNIAGRALIVTSFYQAHDGGADYNYANDTVRVNPLRLARSIWNDRSAAPTRAEIARAAELVIDHEVVHAAQMQAAKDTFAKLPEAEQAQGFMPWVDSHYGAMWRDDLKDVHEATIKTYGAILEGRPDWHKAFEALRMIVQDRTAGSTSEAATFLSDRLRAHLKAALAVLKRWYADVMAGVADKPAIKAEIEAIEALLKDPVKNNSPGNEPAQATSTGAMSTNGTSSESPVKGSTETVAATDGAGSITNENSSRLNFNVPLSKRGQVRAAKFPDVASLAAFQFKQDADIAANARKTPEEIAAAKQRGLALIAALMQDSPLSRAELEQKLLDYHNAVVAHAESTSPLDTFNPPSFASFAKIERKAEVLPAPEGGDIISNLKKEGVNRIGPPTAAAEWDWYNELAREATSSKLSNREAQKLARAGDITDPKARLAWINANVVSTTGGRSIDEAAEDVTGSGEELGRAILAALDARQKAAGQPSTTADEASRAAQEKEGQSSFNTFAAGSEGTPTTAGDLSRAVDAGWEINIGGEWMGVVDADPIDETVTLDSPRFGSVTISGDQSVNITGEPQPPLDGNQVASAPSRYQSPASMLAATQAQMQGAEGAKPAGLSSMFNPKPRIPATGERTLFQMPNKPAETASPADLELARKIVTNLDKVKAVRALLPNEQTAYDKATADLAPQGTLASAPSQGTPTDLADAISAIESNAEDPTDTEYWPENLAEAFADSDMQQAIDNADYAAFYEAMPEKERTEQRQEWYEQSKQLDAVNDRLLKAYRTVNKDPQKVFTPEEWADIQTKPEAEREGRIMSRVNERAMQQLTIPERKIYDDTDMSDAEAFVESDEAKQMALAPFLPQVAARVASTIAQIEATGRYKWNAKTKTFDEQNEPQVLYSAPSSVTPAQDAEYMQAVEDGDVAKQQTMVDAAAKAAGYTIGPVWHGSKGKPTIFDKEFAEREENWSFSDDPEVAESYQSIDVDADKVWKAYEESSGAEREKLGKEFSKFRNEEGEVARESIDAYVEEANMDQPKLWVASLHRITGKPRIYFHSASSPGSVVKAFLKIKNPLHRYFGGTANIQRQTAPQGESDGYIDHDVSDTETGTYRKVSTVYHANEANQIKSAEPITRDAEGNVIPLSQRFNPESNSILYSAPTSDKSAQAREIIESMPKVWQNVLRDYNGGKSIEDIAKDRLYSVAQATHILTQAQGRFAYLQGKATKPKVAPVAGGEPLFKGGRPDLAFSGIPAFAAVDQQRGTPEQVTHAEMQEAATRMFAVDPVAAEKLVTRWMDGVGLAFNTDDMPDGIKAIIADAHSRKASMALMTAAAQIFTVESSFAGGSSAKIARLIDLYRNSGEEISRALSQRQDPFETPAERNAWYLQNVLLVPPPSIRAEMKKNPANKEKILAEWAARADKIKAELLADGIDLDATFKQMAKERALAAATIPEPVKAPLALAPKSTRQAVKAILEGGSWQDALNASGLDLKAAQKAYNSFRGGLRGMMSKAAAAIRDTLGSAPNESESMLPEWTDDANLSDSPIKTAATQALAIQRNRKMAGGEIDLKNPLSVNRARQATGMRKASGFDKLMEYWKASILSGPLSAIVNVSSGVGYGAYEATFKKLSAATMADIARLFGFKPDAPSLQDFPSIFRAVMPSLREAGANMIAAWNTESSLFDSYATDDGLFAGKHNFKDQFDPAIKGTFGKVMRSISFRHMGAADEFVKSFFTRIEVAAQAQQIARNEGKTGAVLDMAMKELMRPGSLAWERALAGAKRITFQNQEVNNKKLDSDRGTGHAAIDVLDNMADAVQRAKMGDFGSTVKVVSSFLFPFVSTPSNIFKTGITMSPAGGLLALLDGARAVDRMRKGNVEEAAKIYNAARAFDDITNQIVCWGFILGLSSLVKPGDGEDELPFITGSGGLGDASSGERELTYRAAPPYSIRIGGKWYSYKRLDPLGTALAFCVDSIREFQSGKSLDKVWAKIGTGMLATMQDKTFMKSISDLANVMRDPERYGTRWIAGIATGFVPNLVRQPPRATDPVFRETDFPNDMSFAESFARRIGFGMYPSPSSPIAPLPAIDVFGRESSKNTGTGQPGTDIMLRLLSPVETRDFANVDKLDVKMLRYNMAHDKGFNFTAPDREIQRTTDGKTIKISLDDAEYLEFEKKSGADFYSQMYSLYGGLARDFTESDHADITRMHSKVMEPHRAEAFGKALQKRIAEGKITL